MTKEDERREYNRVKNEFNVRVAREIKKGQFQDMMIDVARSVNISGSGILLNVKENIGSDSVVRITFLKPNTFEFFESLAKVVRVEKQNNSSFTIGLSFHKLTKLEKDQLDYYITLCE